eukprot:g4585.t1
MTEQDMQLAITLRLVTAGEQLIVQKTRLARCIPDILVGTPEQLLLLFDPEAVPKRKRHRKRAGENTISKSSFPRVSESFQLSLDSLQFVICDEADYLLQPLPRHPTLAMQRNRARHPKPASLLLDHIYFRTNAYKERKKANKQLKERVRAALTIPPKEGEDDIDGDEDDDEVQGFRDFPLPNHPRLILASATVNAPLRGEVVRNRWSGLSRPDPAREHVEEIGRTGRTEQKLLMISPDGPAVPRLAGPSLRTPTSLSHHAIVLPADDNHNHSNQNSDSHDEAVYNGLPNAGHFHAVPAVFAHYRINGALLFLPKSQGLQTALDFLNKAGLRAVALHEVHRTSQQARQDLRQEMEQGRIQLLVTSETSARGLDFPWLDHVIICGATREPVSYLHMAGRTGRAGRKGVVITLCTEKDLWILKKYEQALQIPIQRQLQSDLSYTQQQASPGRPVVVSTRPGQRTVTLARRPERDVSSPSVSDLNPDPFIFEEEENYSIVPDDLRFIRPQRSKAVGKQGRPGLTPRKYNK